MSFKDRIKESTSSTGTADFSLAGAVVNCRSFADLPATKPIPYAALNPANAEWETGIGFYTSGSPNKLSRAIVLANSALTAPTKISFTASPIVWNDVPADIANAISNSNKIINGAGLLDQRNSGASTVPSVNGTYFLDRFALAISQASKLTVGQNLGAVAPPPGFTSYIGVKTTTAFAVLGATDFFLLEQLVEGLNCSDTSWGTAGAQAQFLSCWVYSSLTGTFGGAIVNGALNRSYPFSYSIPAANTWTQIFIPIPGDTTGTWLTTNGIGIRVFFGLGVGTTFSGTAGAWAAAELFSATGAVSVVGTLNATFNVTGLKLETGAAPTPYVEDNFAVLLEKCQRYCEVWDAAFGQNAFKVLGVGLFKVTTRCDIWWPYRTSKRTTATCTFTTASGFDFSDGVSDFAASAMATAGSELEGVLVTGTVSGATAFRPAQCNANANNTAKVIADAEL